MTSEDKVTIRVCDMLRSVAVLHTLDIISVGLPRTTGKTLPVDHRSRFRQLILTKHLETTTGMFTFLVLQLVLCMCIVWFVYFSY